MNSPSAGTGASGHPSPARASYRAASRASSRAYRRIAIAIALSLAIHALFVSEVLSGLSGLFPWLTKGEPDNPVVTARIKAPPPPPPPAPQAVPEPTALPAAAPEPAASRPAPVRRTTPGPAPIPSAPSVLTSPSDAAPVAAGNTSQAGPASDTPAVAAAPTDKSAIPATAPAPRAEAFPARARIDFQIMREADNLTAYGTQTWQMQEGRYRVRLDARLMFFSVAFESSGTLSGSTLAPDRYVDDRRGKVTQIEFAADRKSAQVNEANGNRKGIDLAGQAADLMSLPYALALNPDMPVGTVIMLANRDSIDPTRLMEKRDEVLLTERGPVNTRFYSFKQVEGNGNAQVWLAVDRQWLPAKLRVTGRDGPIAFIATGYKVGE
jgi:hypothetical protein